MAKLNDFPDAFGLNSEAEKEPTKKPATKAKTAKAATAKTTSAKTSTKKATAASKTEKPATEAAAVSEKPKRGRPVNPNIEHKQGKHYGLEEGYTRATFIAKADLINEFKDFAFTDYKDYTEAFEEMLEAYLKKKRAEYKKAGKQLVQHREKGTKR